MSTLAKVTATGNVGTGSKYLQSIVLSPAAAVATLDVRLDGSGGAVVLTLQAAANGASVVWQATDRPGVGAAQPHATLAGAGASASFEYA
jgi:hypothetical protein